MIYVTGGEAKRRRLKSPKGVDTRPTLGKIKKAVFDILQDKVKGARFLDLFSGTGAVAIEALSRGASEAVLVDNRASMIHLAKENLELVNYLSRSRILKGNVMKVINKVAPYGPFEIIFADPPYDFSNYPQLVSSYSPLLHQEGVLVIQHLQEFSIALASDFHVKVRSMSGHHLTMITRKERDEDKESHLSGHL